MAKRGPKPKNARQRAEQGYQHGSGTGDTLRMPDGMGPSGRAMWRKTCRELKAAGKLFSVDEGDIEIVARAWELIKTLDGKLKTAPLLVAGPNGAEYANPLFGMHDRATKKWRDARRDLGLTAYLRMRAGAVMTPAEDAKDEFERFGMDPPKLKIG